MSEQVVEYLYFSKTETPENISDILSETLSPYTIDSKSILIQENKNLTLMDKFHKLKKYRTNYSVEAVVCEEYEKLLYEQTENNLLELLKGFTAKDANGILFKVIDSVKQKTDNLIL